jgi:prepilin-type N-terminal cleavage/methylation domain-containing protein
MGGASPQRQTGFTLVEMLISLVVGSILITTLFKLWNTNRMETDRIQTKSDFRDRATLATTALNRSITMAGFGLSKIDVIAHASGSLSDTLTLYTNAAERRTTLRDSAAYLASEICVFNDSGFAEGSLIGITDSINQQFVRIAAITGDSSTGFYFRIQPSLNHPYASGVPDIFPVQREVFYIDGEDSSLVRQMDDRRNVLARGISEFRVDLRDGNGAIAANCRSIRVITFSVAGSYKASAGTPSLMRFSSTVIPRNLL